MTSFENCMIIDVVAISLFITYSLVIIYFTYCWHTVPFFEIPRHFPLVRFSIIVPARNEEENIAKLLEAISKQDYPISHYEIIVVDDESEDRTAEVARKFQSVKVIEKNFVETNAHKKKAIEMGIASASGDFIVTTDADCIPGPGWLSSLAACIDKTSAVCIAAPVSIQNNSSVVQLFQASDFMVLQGVTAAAVHHSLLSMGNGANLAFKKEIFYEVGGYTGIDSIASGDDMLLLHKIRKRYKNGIAFLKSDVAIMATSAVKTWRAFFEQRIRWASKALYYDDKRITLVLSLVYLFNCSFLMLLVAGFFEWEHWIVMLVLVILKTLIELPFFISLSRFFDKKSSVYFFPFFQPMHIGYTIISGLFSQFGKYEWKGRRVK